MQPVPPLGPTRREALRLSAASLALAGLAGCRPDERARPYVRSPEHLVPGVPRFYATGIPMAGIVQPVLAKTESGRPIKLEGNPDHPASRGATDAFTQAALLGLYDPARSRGPLHDGLAVPPATARAELRAQAARIGLAGGAGFRLLTGRITSPTLLRQIAALLQRWPEARWHVHEPFGEDRRDAAVAHGLGRPLDWRLALQDCEALVSLDDDLLGPGPRQTAHSAGWGARRAAFRAGQGGCALHVAEPTPSITGVAATHRLPAAPASMAALLGAIAAAVGLEGTAAGLAPGARRWAGLAAAALAAHPGRGLLTVGLAYPPALHALALRVNARLGNLGTTLRFTAPAAPSAASFGSLLEDMAAGRVAALAVLDANPAYSAGAEFARLMPRVALRLHAGLHQDETAVLSQWHLALPHALESWTDGRAVDGSAVIVQPAIRPLYEAASVHAILAMLLGEPAKPDHDVVADTWRAQWGDDFDRRWEDALVRGLVAGSVPSDEMPGPVAALAAPEAVAQSGLAVAIRPDAAVWDGRFAANPWLQELPRPIDKTCWGNLVTIGPALAARIGLQAGDEVRLAGGGRSLAGPIWVMPGQADNVVTLTAGYGRRMPGSLCDGIGHDAGTLAPHGALHFAGAELTPTGRRLRIPATQHHFAMDGYDFVRVVGADAQPEANGAAPRPPGPSFYPPQPRTRPAWGMSIDLDACTGCNACVVACVAENNVPVVGAEQVALGRHMHWLRVDRYHEGDPADPRMHMQPVPCMHCEQAPCEMGCPVNATTHSPDGLNQQVYNRCIGTRTCASYCPYKVRRFNWYDYTEAVAPELRAVRNPDVTVRERGVMEKCTYCVQRIEAARIAAKIAGREIADGAVVTACQQACPTRAIVFGDVLDPASTVRRRKDEKRDYSLLGEVNTRPRTTYLAKREGGGE
jgi:molybdopterin-containing oxidoreductase family iron-sulfur binding subunit